jgi:hypothetical protein
VQTVYITNKIKYNQGKPTVEIKDDVIDRGPATIELLTLLETLTVQARKAGGRVITNINYNKLSGN